MIRMFCDELEILIPHMALSAGTLIAIGADSIVMTKQAALGPIDPSIFNPLNPQVNIGGQASPIPVSVENVRGFIDGAQKELKISDENCLTQIFIDLTNHIHPLILGQVFRSQAQIRFLAKKLLSGKIEPAKVQSIIDFLCADSGSHDYTINRREARELGLPIEKCTKELYGVLRKFHNNYTDELQLLEPFSLEAMIPNLPKGKQKPYTFVKSLNRRH